nr:S-layer homology domain-containing protein [Acidimicrobiia bacterium]
LFFTEIEWLADTGTTRGCNPPTNNRYCPDDPVTRGQMAAFLTRALDLPAGPTGAFTDDTGVFEADIEALAGAGITRGCNPPTNNRYCPNDPVTRGQMAAFLTRALSLPGSDSDTFSDDDGSVFEANIEALAAAGITRGCNPPANNRYCPDNPVTRGQMAAFLYRALSG